MSDDKPVMQWRYEDPSVSPIPDNPWRNTNPSRDTGIAVFGGHKGPVEVRIKPKYTECEIVAELRRRTDYLSPVTPIFASELRKILNGDF